MFTFRKHAFKTTEQTSFGTPCGCGLKWLLRLLLLWSVYSVANTITKPRIANVQRHRAHAGCNSYETVSDYYKGNVLFPFVDHVVQEVDSRFSQRHQGLILADRRWKWALTPVVKLKLSNSTGNSLQEASLSGDSKVKKKVLWKFSLRRAARCNCKFATLSHIQPFTRSLPFFLLPPWGVLVVNDLCRISCCGTSRQWTRNAWLTEGCSLFIAWDGLRTGSRGDLPNEAKSGGSARNWLLTEFPE